MKPSECTKFGTRQHWVSRGLMRAWSDRRDDRILAFNKVEGKTIGPISTSKLCVGSGHLDFPIKIGFGATADHTFSGYEADALPVIDAIRQRGSLRSLKPKSCLQLRKYISALRHASLAKRKAFPTYHDWSLESEPALAEKLSINNSTDHTFAHFAMIVERAPLFEEGFLKTKRMVLRRDARRRYVLSDNPVVLFNPFANTEIHETGLAHSTTDVILPISPEYLLHFATPTDKLDRRGTNAQWMPLPPPNVDQIDDDDLLVEFCNFMQLTAAERHIIIADEDDAAGLRKLLDQFPDARRPPRWMSIEDLTGGTFSDN